MNQIDFSQNDYGSEDEFEYDYIYKKQKQTKKQYTSKCIWARGQCSRRYCRSWLDSCRTQEGPEVWKSVGTLSSSGGVAPDWMVCACIDRHRKAQRNSIGCMRLLYKRSQGNAQPDVLLSSGYSWPYKCARQRHQHGRFVQGQRWARTLQRALSVSTWATTSHVQLCCTPSLYCGGLGACGVYLDSDAVLKTSVGDGSQSAIYFHQAVVERTCLNSHLRHVSAVLCCRVGENGVLYPISPTHRELGGEWRSRRVCKPLLDVRCRPPGVPCCALGKLHGTSRSSSSLQVPLLHGSGAYALRLGTPHKAVGLRDCAAARAPGRRGTNVWKQIRDQRTAAVHGCNWLVSISGRMGSCADHDISDEKHSCVDCACSNRSPRTNFAARARHCRHQTCSSTSTTYECDSQSIFQRRTAASGKQLCSHSCSFDLVRNGAGPCSSEGVSRAASSCKGHSNSYYRRCARNTKQCCEHRARLAGEPCFSDGAQRRCSAAFNRDDVERSSRDRLGSHARRSSKLEIGSQSNARARDGRHCNFRSRRRRTFYTCPAIPPQTQTVRRKLDLRPDTCKSNCCGARCCLQQCRRFKDQCYGAHCWTKTWILYWQLRWADLHSNWAPVSIQTDGEAANPGPRLRRRGPRSTEARESRRQRRNQDLNPQVQNGHGFIDQENVQILHMNIRGYKSNALELESYISLLEARPALVCLNETFLDNSTKHISLPGYCVASRRDRNDGRMGGGIMVLVRSDIAVSTVEVHVSTTAERSWLVMHTTHGPLLLCCWYRPPAPGDTACITSWETEWHSLAEHAVCTVVIGDVNCHHVNWLRYSTHNSPEGAELRRIMSSNGLRQHVTEPTRGENLLDLVLSDCGCISTRTLPAIADHRGVLASIRFSMSKFLTQTRTVWQYCSADWTRLQDGLQQWDWTATWDSTVDDSAYTLEHVIHEQMDACIPKKQLPNTKMLFRG